MAAGQNAAGGASVGTISLNLAINGANIGNQITQAVNQGAAGAITTGGMAIANIVGNLAVQGINMIVSKAKDAVIKGIDFASDLTETQNVVDVAFGDMAYKAEEFAKTAIDAFGISELSAKQASSTFMAMSKGMGIASEAASDMSINVAKLAADTASFFNLDYDTAQNKLKAIWTGETEGLKSLGVVMTQANLKAFALREGIEKDVSEMNQAELVALRYKYVMEQLSLAQGDFVRSEDSWANMTKKLSESWNAFLGKIGAGMIQVLTPFLNLLTDIVSELNKLADEMGWGKMEEKAQEAGENIGEAMTEGVNDAVDNAKEKMMGLLGMDEIQKLTGSDKSSESGSDLSDFDAGVYPDKKDEQEAETLMSKFFTTIKSKWSEFKTWVSPMTDKIFEVGQTAFENFKAIGEDVFNILKEFWNKSGDDIKNIIERVVSLVTTMFDQLFKGIKRFWDNGGKAVFQTLYDILSEVYSTISDIWTVLGPALEETIKDLLPYLIDGFTMFARTLAGILKIVQSIVEALHSMLTFDVEKRDALGLKAGNDFLTGINMISTSYENLPNLSRETKAFADGGIVSKPTLGYVGEYPGASTNPEAIAPISDLKDIMIAALKESGYSDDREITIPLTVNLGTKTIVSETVKAINRETKRRNKEVIVTTK